MLCGKVVRVIESDGKKYTFRYPCFEDYPETRKYFNRLIAEGAMIGSDRKSSTSEEMEHTAATLKRIEGKTKVLLLVEHEGRIFGEAKVDKKTGVKSHVGELGINLDKALRGKGLGQALMEEIIKEAKKRLRIEMLELQGFSQNKAAIGLYKKMGFREAGTIKRALKRNGKYYDQITMVKYLK
ncbi:MAG: GNAT family N-acetyltransferase [Candidatus Aenigmarchaeota archaeon]|nr:GNAT family N-acetyltransferase [Candidatus Aenigmarchaeota archaeon]